MRLLGRGLHSRALISAAVLIAAVGGLVSSGPAATAEENRPALALGDSVPFGYITQAGHAYVNPSNFVGFPEYTGRELRLDMTNASCPGETSGSLITGLHDHGCLGYRHFRGPLHVAYGGTQLDYAISFLHHHRNTRLVTLLIGANDGFQLQESCAFVTSCIVGGLPALTATIGTNLDSTFAALHHAGFRGVLVVMTYYSLDYTDALGTGFVTAINNKIIERTLAAHGVIADGFGAFQHDTLAYGGKTCKAGLLNVDPLNQSACDVHPSQSGQDLLAAAVVRAYHDALSKDENFEK